MKIKPSVFWPAVIAGALALHVAAMMVMVSIATSNDSYAVEPDYYRKSLAWNEKQAQDRRNAELGWSLDFVVEPASPGGEPGLQVTLVDADGSPLDGAEVAVEAFSNIRRNDILTATLIIGDGAAATTLPMRRDGLWEFRFSVTRGSDVFTHRETRHIWTQISDE
ncbi:MAG: FixH family protein [Thermoanaerobaculales bacterium]|jgi:nitrogen fixation protein FixH|nr:FixH family protein [Thermoanaerobaculales bacterium]